MTTLALTERDMEVLAFLDAHYAVALPHLAALFFHTNPFSGAKNANPLKACERRITALREHGYIALDRVRDRGRVDLVARPARAANAPLGRAASRRRVAVVERVHHLRTLDAVEAMKLVVAQRRGRIVSFRLEAALRAEKHRGRRTRRGDWFESFPDAVCTIAVPGPNGERVFDIAVEYVTSKYTDADIRAKSESFRRAYAESFWFADRSRTAARVARIVGGKCSTLS